MNKAIKILYLISGLISIAIAFIIVGMNITKINQFIYQIGNTTFTSRDILDFIFNMVSRLIAIVCLIISGILSLAYYGTLSSGDHNKEHTAITILALSTVSFQILSIVTAILDLIQIYASENAVKTYSEKNEAIDVNPEDDLENNQ